MSRPALVRALDHIRATAGRPTPLGDDILLNRFVANRDEAAFAELVRRFGPLVRGVARRQLADAHEADDITQGTFLALARQANRVNDGRPLAGWLFTVAHRLACKAQVRAARRPGPPKDDVASTLDPLAALTARELVAALDDELARLPERYRLPLILCAMEGLSRDEAAARLGWTLGSFRGRLERGRELLRARLTKRGLTVPAVFAGGLMATPAEAIPPALVRTIARAAMALPPAATPLTLLMAAAVVLTAFGAGTGIALLPGGQPTPKAVSAEATPVDHAFGSPAPPRVDTEGVPLPPGAIARLGTARFKAGGYRVALSADGTCLIGVNSSASVRTWDAMTGDLLREYRLTGRPQGDVMISPDGSCGAARVHGGVAFWDIATGRELRTVPLPPRVGGFYRVAFTANGRLFANCEYDGGSGKLVVTNPEDGSRTTVGETPREFEGMAFSPDGKWIATADDDLIRVWDVAGAKEIWRIKGAGDFVAWSPNTKLLAVASDDSIRILDATSGQSALMPALPSSLRSTGLRFSPDSSSLLFNTNDGVTVWDLVSGRARATIKEKVSPIGFARDGKSFFTSDGTLQRWDATNGRPLWPDIKPLGHRRDVHALAFAPDGRRLVSLADDESLRYWDVATARSVWTAPTPSANGTWRMGVTPDGRGILLGDREGAISLHDSADGQVRRRFEIEGGGAIGRFCLTPDGATVLSEVSSPLQPGQRTGGNELFSWEFGTGKLRQKQTGLPNSRFGGTFTPDGQTLIGDRGELFDVAMGKVGRTLSSAEHIGRCFAASADSVFAAAPIGTTEQVDGWHQHRPLGVQVWELASSRPLPRIDAGDTILLVFSPDGRSLASAELDVIRLWDVATGRELYRLSAPAPQRSVVTASFAGAMAFAPDGRTLATGHPDGTILIWDVSHIVKRVALPPPTAEERRSLWADLLADDPGRAAKAIDRLAADAKGSVAILRDRLQPRLAAPSDMQRLLADLNSDLFSTRETASRKLAEADSTIEQTLKTALAANPPPEAKRRIATLLDRPKPWPADLPSLRMVRLLERIATPAAKEHLKALAAGAPGATLTRAAAEALKRLNSHQ